nr:hypothetical protein [Tanacetum cinerariifolium]
MTFDDTSPPSKTSPFVDDDLDEDETIKITEKKNLENDIVDETLEIDEIVNIKESRNHPLENVIGYLNQRTLSLACQDMCDEVSKIMHDEFEMSMTGELNFFLGLQIKQMEDDIFFNQSKYIKEMLKKFGLEDSKPMKTPMSSDTKLTKDKQCESAPKTSHLEAVKRILRYIKGTMHLGLWYPKGTGIETIVYADSDYAGDYVDRKSTSGIRTFVGCCLTSWFLKKQTALSISTTEAEYLERKPRKDRGTIRGRHSSSSSTSNQPSSSYLNDYDDDGNNKGISRAKPFYTRQTEFINRHVQIRDEHRGGLRSIGKGFQNLWRNLKKK